MEDNNNGATTPTATESGLAQPPVDYKAQYEQALLEIEKQKKVKDQYAKENADYKKKQQEQMTDDEKRQAELKELIESKNQIEAELQSMKLEKDLLANGFTAEESEKLIKGNFAVKDIADILKARIDANTKSVKAELIKDTTPATPLGNGTAKDTKSSFQLYQESKRKDVKKVEL